MQTRNGSISAMRRADKQISIKTTAHLHLLYAGGFDKTVDGLGSLVSLCCAIRQDLLDSRFFGDVASVVGCMYACALMELENCFPLLLADGSGNSSRHTTSAPASRRAVARVMPRRPPAPVTHHDLAFDRADEFISY